MKIGIYLGYSPCGKNFSLKREGLGRYLSHLIKGFVKNKNEIIIACPRWLIDAINELLEEENIPYDLVKFLIPNDMPFIYKIYLSLFDRDTKLKHKRLYKIQLVAFRFIDRVIGALVNVKNFVSFGIIATLFIILGIIIIPFFIIILLFYLIIRIVKSIVRSKMRLENREQGIIESVKKIIKQNILVKSVKNKVFPLISMPRIKEKMRINSANEIIRMINQMPYPPDVWYCPMAFWEEFNQINGVKVICAPDLVTAELPINFTDLDYTITTDNVRNTISNGIYFITYCDYLKRTLLVNKFSKSTENVIAIPHAHNDMLEFIDVKNYFKTTLISEDANEFFCKRVVFPSLKNNAISIQKEYLNTQGSGYYAFGDMKYIFYSSQVRPNKNIVTLVKAYEYILREKGISIKLILTGSLAHDADVKDYIYKKRLQYDILSFFNVTNQQLAALYMQAELVVNPTLYEGGFPFTFGEGMSVGTPSIMSNIPQVMEVVSGYNLEDCIFDPYDYKDLAEKIIFGLEHKDYIYKKQKTLYDVLSSRGWEDVCKDYELAFKYFIDKEGNKKYGM